MKLKMLDKNAHWWAKTKTNWVTQDKDGHYWIIPGSEFPEKKIDIETQTITKIKSNEGKLRFMLFVIFGSFLGGVLAGLLFSLIL